MNSKHHTHQVSVIGYVYRGGKFLLLKRATEPKIWAPPGGRLHQDEDPSRGLIREIKEETNLAVEVIAPANTWFGKFRGKYLLSIDYLVRIISGDVKLSHEHSDFAWVSVAELRGGRPVDLGSSAVGFKVSDFEHAERLIKTLSPNG